jgi:tripartite ATP-independent transporter DctM subunit
MTKKIRPISWLVDGLNLLFTFGIILVPVLDKIIQKAFPKTGGIHNSNLFVSFSVIALCFLSAILTTRGKKHLSISIMPDHSHGWRKTLVESFNLFMSLAVTLVFLSSSLVFTLTGIGADAKIGFIPERILYQILPLSFLLMASYFIAVDEAKPAVKALVSAAAILLGLAISFPAFREGLTQTGSLPPALEAFSNFFNGVYPGFHVAWVILLIVGAFTGTPLFVVLGGLAFSFFTHDQTPISSIPSEWVGMLRGDMIPALPLFTVVGFILSESKAGQRLIDVFKCLFGWMPGGMVVVAVLVCTFFTTFTGASGVTILALGGLLGYILKESGKYPDDFNQGVLTASGSIGIMLPPSLAVIMYAVFASLDIPKAFMGTLLPGLLLVLAMCVAGVVFSVKTKAPTFKFEGRAALKSIISAFWELLLPILIVACYALGITTISEAAAYSVVYVIVIEVIVKREIKLRDLPRVMMKGLTVIGGTLIILIAARGLALYIIYVDLPSVLTAWVASWVHSKFVFLILLNILLLLVGCFLDVFSAIMVVAPLLFPMAAHFGINPYHLASIFLMNLGIGFLTPPVGMNLFLASYTFEQPLIKIYKRIVPFLLIQLGVLIMVTYVPWLSTALVR